MNHFFGYVQNDVNVFQDADFVEPCCGETTESITIPEGADLEIEEAVRFLRGDNISFEEVLTKDSCREGLIYKAYIHTQREVNMERLEKRIADILKQKMTKGFEYTLKVERDRPISYSPSRKDYVVTIKV